MEFLLECIGFPPDQDFEALAASVRRKGESVAWRGPAGEHLRLPLGNGLELRLDREEDQGHWTLWPFFHVDRRLRVAVQHLQAVPDSPFDAFLVGLANPPLPDDCGETADDSFPLSTYISDARRLPRRLRKGQVMAVSVAGFALDVSFVGPNGGACEPSVLERPHGALLDPLGGEHAPGGTMEVSLRVREVRHVRNPLTGVEVGIVEADVPGRPISLFVSRWQLEADGFQLPRPGWRVEGVFLFSGRAAGGLGSPARVAGGSFG